MKLVLSCLLFSLIFSQTDVVLYELSVNKKGDYSLKKPLNISNRSGYDNQPKFGKAGWNLYYSSNRDGKQTDIYRYHIPFKKEYNISETPDNSEYSPQPTPLLVEISAVKVTGDLQNLWIYPIDNYAPVPVKAVFFDKVGYYCWIGNKAIAAFVLPAPFDLYWYDIKTSKYTKITNNIGRSLHENQKTGRLNFLKKKTDTQYEIYELIWSKNEKGEEMFEIKKVIDGLDNSQDFAISKDGDYVMAQGTVLYLAKHGSKKWVKFYDVKKDKFGNVTRLDISNRLEHLAVTVDRN
ncbi:MAG: hypothetical protein KDD94_02815 [Calditrichaeota bacterium]|nr:hypothetical protein [Calditrichota bacterium]